MKFNVEAGKRVLWTAFGVLWLGGVVTGLGLLASYDNTPGVAARAPERWPAKSGIAPAQDRPTLVMVAHPRCACTNASIAEFAELLARATTTPRAYVVFIEPAGVQRDWSRTALWDAANRIPGVTVIRDAGGVEAGLFGVETSGQTFLYSAGGQLLFSGGTTGARGHRGDNAGRASLLALLNRNHPQHPETSVFGCPLSSHVGRGWFVTPAA